MSPLKEGPDSTAEGAKGAENWDKTQNSAFSAFSAVRNSLFSGLALSLTIKVAKAEVNDGSAFTVSLRVLGALQATWKAASRMA